MDEFACKDCGVAFPSRQALGGHRSQHSCDSSANSVLRSSPIPPVPADTNAVTSAGATVIGLIRDGAPRTICQLITRPTHDMATHNVHEATVTRRETIGDDGPIQVHEVRFSRRDVYIMFVCIIYVYMSCFLILQTQQVYEEYLALVREQFSNDFWRVFGVWRCV